MAFVGRMNKRANLADCEVNGDGRLKMKPYAAEDEVEIEVPQSRCSRTYIKTYNLDRSELVSIPSTVRFVGGSGSSCEVNSMADTEMSTLRCNSPRSMETLTLCQSSMESSENVSLQESNEEYTDPATDDSPQQSMVFEKHQLERCSTTSMCSWEPEEVVSIYEEAPPTELESQCGSVPLLELGSETVSLYADPQEQLGQLKILRQSNEAYDNWLSGKKRQYQYKQQAARDQKKLEQEKAEERRQLNEKRVQEWCKRKAQQNSSAQKRRTFNAKTTNRGGSEAQLHLQAWEMRKIQEAEQRRQIQECLAYRKEQQRLQRKENAALAWNEWIKGVAQRPKPVPLSQGFKTLRGTISDIYINPNQWVHVNANSTN